jgi:hypothetical protein
LKLCENAIAFTVQGRNDEGKESAVSEAMPKAYRFLDVERVRSHFFNYC